MTKKLTRKLAIEYMCHECNGKYADGKHDCECVRCPLYSYFKYAKMEPDLSFINYNPSRSGSVTWEDSKRNLTEEQRNEIAQRLSSNRDR